MKKTKEIEFHYNKANEIALSEVERMARKILREHPHLDEFIMAMGSYFFTDKKGENVDVHNSIYRNGGYSYTDSFKYFKPLNDFMSEWDSVLKLTCEGMRFTATGKKITDW